MKKVMILTAAILALSYATPQVVNAMKVQNDIAIMQEKEVKYTEVKVEEIPEAVTKSIAAAYVGYTIDKAFLGDDASYKVKVSKGDVKEVIFYNANGDLIKVEASDKKVAVPEKL